MPFRSEIYSRSTPGPGPEAAARPGPPAPNGDRSIVGLLKSLRDDATVLFRQEVALAKTEMAEKATRVGKNVAYLAVGGLIAYTGLIFLLIAITQLIRVGLVAAGMGSGNALWLAALIVGGVVALVGYILLQKAIYTLRNASMKPEKTIDSLQENKEWLAHKIR